MKTEFWYPPGFPRAEERFLQRCALALASLAGFIIFLCQFSSACARDSPAYCVAKSMIQVVPPASSAFVPV